MSSLIDANLIDRLPHGPKTLTDILDMLQTELSVQSIEAFGLSSLIYDSESGFKVY